ncbi:MAG: hypothetical protein AB7P69_10060, partial [Candidatus Binatia bacterium]
SKSFNPTTIGPGSVSTLTFTIDNTDEVNPVTDLAFVDMLPAGVTIASPANAATTCTDGVVNAPSGGATISFSDGRLVPDTSCIVTVDVTSSVSGTHMNVSGDLTSSAGNSGTAAADLTVSTGRLGFTKSFTPNPIVVGTVSVLTFTIDNTANASLAVIQSFTDNLPAGLEVANPANASTSCTAGTLTATPGTSVISYVNGIVSAMSSCTVTVEVTASIAGTLGNTTGVLTSNLGSSGKASATLVVNKDFLVKTFIDDPAPPGGTVTLEFTLTNFDRTNSATNISFTDDLDATLSDLVAVGLPLANPCGAGSQLTGTSLLTLTGGNLPAEGSCTFQVTLQVPAAASVGTYANNTSSVTANIGGSPVTLDPATDNLSVDPIPLLIKTFLDNPAAAGDVVTVEFMITNTDTSAMATSIAFTDNLTVFLPGTTAVGLPLANICGAGSSITTTLNNGDLSLSMTGGNLAAGDSCTFQIPLQTPTGVPSGTYSNTTSPITATVGGVTRIGNPATDDLVVVSAPVLQKDFTDDPVVAGETVTLEFTLSHSENAPADATGIAFTDDLDAALSGLVATGLPLNDVCGAGSQISGAMNLSFTGGSLAPGASCTFSVTLQTPAGAVPGPYTNTTSDVTATVLGLAATADPTSAVLNIAGLSLTKSFTDDPTVPDGPVTLQFTLSNASASANYTNIAFTDNLNTTLSGLAAIGLPLSDICGMGSQINGTTNLGFTGGSLAPSGSCTFSVTLQTPAGAAPGEYPNTTSSVTADRDSTPVTIGAAADNLVITSVLSLTKSFTDDPILPSEPVTLEFTLTNAHPVHSATGISFTDDLDATLSELVASGLPANDVCGTGSQLSGTNLLTLTGGNLSPGGSCTFSVTLQTPSGAILGSYVNTTSMVTATVNSSPVTGDAAQDSLIVDAVPVELQSFTIE